MSSEVAWLALRLEGPLQSWGFDSQYNRRATALMPTKSAIAGICCAALGLSRGSDSEREFLSSFAATKMLSIAIPRPGRSEPLDVRRLQDYHTVQNTRTADGKTKDCHITRREYLTDASFGVIVRGDTGFLDQIGRALANPTWGLWLGRKTCIPAAPVLVGVFHSEEEAIVPLIGDTPITKFTRQEDVESFAEGRDSLPDQAVSFASEAREFAPRRIRTLQGA